jgi:hypothetical protein
MVEVKTMAEGDSRQRDPRRRRASEPKRPERERPDPQTEPVEEASDESFPAGLGEAAAAGPRRQVRPVTHAVPRPPTSLRTLACARSMAAPPRRRILTRPKRKDEGHA